MAGVSGGGAFIFETNLGIVARQIEQELTRIQRATAKSAGSVGGGAGNDFMGGYNARLKRIATDLDKELGKVSGNFNRELQRSAEAGKPTSARVNNQTILQATRPAIDSALKQIGDLTAAVATSLPPALQPMRQQLLGSLQNASNHLVQGYRQTVTEVAKGLESTRRDLGVPLASKLRGQTYDLPVSPGGKRLDEMAARAATGPSQPFLGKLDRQRHQQLIAGLQSAGQQQERLLQQATQQAQEVGRQTAANLGRELRANRPTEPGYDPDKARRVRGVTGVPGSDVFYDNAGRTFQRDPEFGGLRQFDKRSMEPHDREIMERADHTQRLKAVQGSEIEAHRTHEYQTRQAATKLYRAVEQGIGSGALIRSGNDVWSGVNPQRIARIDPRTETARELSGVERDQARERMLREAETTARAHERKRNEQAEAQQRGRREQFEQQHYRRLSGELERGAAIRTAKGTGSVVRAADNELWRIDPAKQRARMLAGQEAAGAQSQVETELKRRQGLLAQERKAGWAERERETRDRLAEQRVQGRATRSMTGRYWREPSAAGPVIYESTQKGKGARRITDPSDLIDAERKLAQERASAARAAERVRRAEGGGVRGGGEAGHFGGGGGGPLDRFFSAAAHGPGGSGRGLRGQDIAYNAFNYVRYFAAATAVLGVVRALTMAKAAAVDYRESLTDLEVALGQQGRATAGFISGLSDIARFAGANTGAAIDSAVRGIRAFTSTYPGIDEQGQLKEDPGFQERAEDMGLRVARASQQLAVIAEKELKDATGDVISIGFAFELTEEGAPDAALGRIIDSIAVAKRTLSGDAKEIAQGLSSVGAVAAEAGFSLEETANLVSLVQARTDQTGRAVATRLSRIFSIIGGSQGRNAIEQLNTQLDAGLKIDTSGSVRDQLTQLSQIYGELSSQQQGFVRNALGGAANTRELVPILQSPDRLAEALDAQFYMVGAGAEEFDRKARDLAGTLRRLKGDVQGTVTGLFEAGLGDVFLLALQGVLPFTDALRQLLNVYNRMFDVLNKVNVGGRGVGDWMQTAIMLTLQYRGALLLWDKAAKSGLISKGLAVTSGTTARAGMMNANLGGWMNTTLGARGGAAGMGGVLANIFTRRGTREGLLGELSALHPPRRGPAGDLASIETQMARSFSMTNTAMDGFRAGLSGASMTFSYLGDAVSKAGKAALVSARNFIAANPVLVLAAGALLIANAWDKSKRAQEATLSAAEALSSEAPRTAAELRDFATALRQQAEETREAVGGIFGGMSDRVFNDGAGRTAAGALDARAVSLFEFSKELEEAQRTAARSRTAPADLIRLDTSEGVRDSLKILTDEGLDATTRVDALGEAIARMADRATSTATVLTELEQLEFGYNLADRAITEVEIGANLQRTMDRNSTKGIFERIWNFGAQADKEYDEILRQLADEDVRGKLETRIREIATALPANLDDLDRSQLTDSVERVFASEVEGWGDVSEELREEMRTGIELAILAAVGVFENVDDPLVAIEASRAIMEELRSRRGERTTQLKLAKGVGAPAELTAAEEALSEARLRRDQLREAGATARGLQQMDRDIAELELEVINLQVSRIDALAKVSASRFAPTADLERLRTELDAVKQKLATSQDSEQIEQLQSEQRELQYREAQIILDRTNAQARSASDVEDTTTRAWEEANAAQRALELLISQDDTESTA
jgi:hypothetical protein